MLDTENQSMKDIALEACLCSEEQLNEIVEDHIRLGSSIKDLLIDFQLASEKEILNAIGKKMGFPVMDLKEASIPDNIIELLDGSTVRSLGVVPIDYDGYAVTVVTRNPLNFLV